MAYTTPPLTPGVVEEVVIPPALPYRFWVQAADTPAQGLWAYPAMGSPELLCTGV